jgi:hypothetical protein
MIEAIVEPAQDDPDVLGLGAEPDGDLLVGIAGRERVEPSLHRPVTGSTGSCVSMFSSTVAYTCPRDHRPCGSAEWSNPSLAALAASSANLPIMMDDRHQNACQLPIHCGRITLNSDIEVSLIVGAHHLDGPGSARIGAAPNVMNAGTEILARQPEAQRVWWIGGMQIPPAQGVLDGLRRDYAPVPRAAVGPSARSGPPRFKGRRQSRRGRPGSRPPLAPPRPSVS